MTFLLVLNPNPKEFTSRATEHREIEPAVTEALQEGLIFLSNTQVHKCNSLTRRDSTIVISINSYQLQ